MNNLPKADVLSQDDFRLFQELILKESGIHFNCDQKDTLAMSLAERLEALKIAAFKDYYDFISKDAKGHKELAELIDLITIGETEFFRTPAHFEVLRSVIIPEIVNRKFGAISQHASSYFAKPLIKVWSAGCSTGEEPYTLAVSFLEEIPALSEQGAVSIIATDVNRDRLAMAKDGAYRERALRNLSPDMLYKYFSRLEPQGERQANRYEVNYPVKKMVKFFHHNLAKDKPDPEYMGDVDIIFCRNVLIYFDLPNTKRIIDNFYDSLNDDGYLIIGPAETLWQISDKFRPVEFPHVFIYRKQFLKIEEKQKPLINIPWLNLEDISFKAGEEVGLPSQDKEYVFTHEKELPFEECNSRYQEGIALFKGKEYDKALVIFDEIIKSNPKFVQAYFGKATILSNQGRYGDAIAELKRIIKVDNLFIEAYYLMGVLFDRLGELDKAVDEFHKVIYIDPRVVLAYFNLGNIFQCQKKFKRAEREFRNAIAILNKAPKDEVVAFSEDVTADVLLAACNKSIEAVDAG